MIVMEFNSKGVRCDCVLEMCRRVLTWAVFVTKNLQAIVFLFIKLQCWYFVIVFCPLTKICILVIQMGILILKSADVHFILSVLNTIFHPNMRFGRPLECWFCIHGLNTMLRSPSLIFLRPITNTISSRLVYHTSVNRSLPTPQCLNISWCFPYN